VKREDEKEGKGQNEKETIGASKQTKERTTTTTVCLANESGPPLSCATKGVCKRAKKRKKSISSVASRYLSWRSGAQCS
jgi:hypothetical protein